VPVEPLDPAGAPVPVSRYRPGRYLRAVSAVLAAGEFDALLPIREQAWLFAVARDRLPPAAPVALAPPESFARVQSKVAGAACSMSCSYLPPSLRSAGVAHPRGGCSHPPLPW
jgi:hypothetical protein